jgi:uncharacterized membrane protein YfcA
MCLARAPIIGAPLGGAVLNRYGAAALSGSAFVVTVLAVSLYVLIHPAITAPHVEAARVLHDDVQSQPLPRSSTGTDRQTAQDSPWSHARSPDTISIGGSRRNATLW